MAKAPKLLSELAPGDKLFVYYSDCSEILELVVDEILEDGTINAKTKKCGYDYSYIINDNNRETEVQEEIYDLFNIFITIISTSKSALKQQFEKTQENIINNINDLKISLKDL